MRIASAVLFFYFFSQIVAFCNGIDIGTQKEPALFIISSISHLRIVHKGQFKFYIINNLRIPLKEIRFILQHPVFIVNIKPKSIINFKPGQQGYFAVTLRLQETVCDSNIYELKPRLKVIPKFKNQSWKVVLINEATEQKDILRPIKLDTNAIFFPLGIITVEVAHSLFNKHNFALFFICGIIVAFLIRKYRLTR